MQILDKVMAYDGYKRTDADLTASELGTSNYKLWKEREGCLKTHKLDPGDSLSSKIGTGFHMVAEKALETEDVDTEVPMDGIIAGYKVTGTADVIFDNGLEIIIGDFKTMGMYGMQKLMVEGTDKFVPQLSIYAYLYAKKYNKPMPMHGEIYAVGVGDKKFFSKAAAEAVGAPKGAAVPKLKTYTIQLMTEEEVEKMVIDKMEALSSEPAVDCEGWLCNYCEFECEYRGTRE